MKAINAAHGRYIKNPASLDGADFPESVKESIRTYTPNSSWEPHPYPPYAMTNNGANIRRLMGRIADLERRAATVATPDVHLESGVTITEDAGRDSVNIRFPGKPSEEVRGRLKAFGFRWSRTEGTWYAKRSNRTTYALGILFPERGANWA